MFVQILLSIFAFVIGLHLYFRYNYSGRLLNKIRGPRQTFLFGNFFDIFISPDILFNKQIEWRQKYGPIWKLCAFNYRTVYVYKPEDIEVVLSSTQYIAKNLPYDFLVPWLQRGLLTSQGEKWHHRRKMLTPAFHFQILKKFFPTFCEHSQELVNNLEKELYKDKTDLFPIISKATLGLICETSMGTSTGEDSNIESFKNKYFKPLHTVAWTMMYRITRIWLYTDTLFQFTNVARIQKTALKSLNKFTTQIIQDRREYRKNNNISGYYVHDEDDTYGKKGKLAMLDLLLDEEAKGRIDEAGITEEVDTFMFEGHDTTATALCFMIMRLANEPRAQDSIAEELKSIFGDSQRPPTLEDLSQMKYLDCCIKESLRLYPSVHFMSRYFAEDVKIGDVIVPHKTMCHFNVFDIHRNPDIFPDPEKFIPERFLPENCVSRHPYAYIPFSAGPRNCIEDLFTDTRLYNKLYGRIWKMQAFNLRSVAISNPKDIEMILSSTTYNEKNLPYNFLYTWLRDGLLVSKGAKWHQRRKMLTPAFHFKILNEHFHSFWQRTQDLLLAVENEHNKEQVDLKPLFTKATLLVMCETSFGTKVEDTPAFDKYLKSIHDMGECVLQRLTQPWLADEVVYSLSANARREKFIVKKLHNFTKQIVEKRREKRMLNSKNAVEGNGHDTTASALTFMVMRIANEPVAQDRIYEELKDIYGDSQRQLTVEDLNRMRYLECCIKESLRLYPSVPFLSRYIKHEVDIAGYTIPSKTFCNIHVFDVHRDPEVYPDPERFIPERFLPENVVTRSPYSYIPFSAGPRNCIGQKFAMMELKTVMSELLWKYQLEPITKPEDIVFATDL
ncbi:hypothetical protein SFRURICE_009537, partial [Spodoptera frugiperda]